jgi:hypothetical protein
LPSCVIADGHSRGMPSSLISPGFIESGRMAMPSAHAACEKKSAPSTTPAAAAALPRRKRQMPFMISTAGMMAKDRPITRSQSPESIGNVRNTGRSDGTSTATRCTEADKMHAPTSGRLKNGRCAKIDSVGERQLNA